MTKFLDIIDQNQTVMEPLSSKSFMFTGTYYYISTKNNTTDHIYLYRYDADWTNETLVTTFYNAGYSVVSSVLTKLNSKYYHLAISFDLTNTKVVLDTSSDGATWSTETRTYASKNLFTCDLCYVNSALYAVFMRGGGGLGFYKYDAIAVFEDAVTAEDIEASHLYLRGMTDTNYIYPKYETITNTGFELRSFNGTTITTLTSMTLSSADTASYALSFFGKSTSAYIIGWFASLNSAVWYYSNSVWTQLASTGNPTPIWDVDMNLKATSLGSIYLTITNDIILKETIVTALTEDLRCGCNDYIISQNSNLFMKGLTSANRFLEVIPTHIVEDAPIAKFKTLEALLYNEYIAIYDDSDNLIHAGEAKNITTVNGISDGTIKSLLEIDLDREITYTGSAETIATLFSNIITTYFKYGSAGTLTSAATTYNWNFQTRKIRDIFSEAAHIEGRVWYSTIALAIQLNAGTIDSTKTFKSSDGKYPASISKTTNNQKIGVVTGYGAAGISYTYTKDASNGLITLHLPSLALTELTAYVTKYANLENATQTQYTLTYLFGLLPLQVGQQLTFEYVLGDYNVASALMYIKEMEYDALDNYILRLVLHDVMIFKKSQLTTQQCFAYTREVDAAKLDTTTDASTYVARAAFHASTTTATSISNNSFTVVPFETEVYDYGSNFDATTDYRFECAIAGIYHFDVSVLLASAAGWGAGELANIAIYKNNNFQFRGKLDVIEYANTRTMHLTLSGQIECAATDYVTIKVYQNSGGAIALNGEAAYNYIMGYRVY